MKSIGTGSVSLIFTPIFVKKENDPDLFQGPDPLFLIAIDQGIVCGVQDFLDGLQLACLDMLGTALDFNETFAGHVASIDLQHTDKIRLP